jgi:hypothetical protein
MKRQKIKPAKGASVLNPRTGKPLNKKGERVIWTQYWDRRLAEKSIILVEGELKDRIEKQNKAKAEAQKKAEAEAKKNQGAKKPGVEG